MPDNKHNAGLFHGLLWGTMVISFIICFIIRIPVNKNLIASVSPEIVSSEYEIAKYADGVLITKYNGDAKNLEIPLEYQVFNQTYKVNGISANAFANTNIESVIIPEGITDIYSNAFSGCKNLRVVTLPNSIKQLSVDAFSDCVITEYHGPTKGLIALDQKNLDKLYLTRGSLNASDLKPTTMLEYFEVSENVSLNGDLRCVINSARIYADQILHLKDTYVKDITIISGEISHTVFAGFNNVYSITLEEGVTKIGTDAFQNTHITEIYIPASCTNIQSGLFKNCKDLIKIIVSPDNPNYNSDNNVNGIVETSTNKLVAGCKDTVLYEGITEIGNYALESLYLNNELILPSTVTTIGLSAFAYCENLENLVIPSNITTINGGAFAECKNLKTVVMTDSVTYLGVSVFINCENLRSIELSNNITELKNGVFKGCSLLSTINIPDHLKKVEDNAFSECSSLQSITLPNTVNSIGNYAFYKCSSLKSAIFPNKHLGLGTHIFGYCSSLESFNYPETTPSIPEYMFERCTKLTDFSFGDEIIIHEGAFTNCISLTTITLPDNLQYIYNESFSYCSNLETIYMGNKVLRIGENAFVFTGLKTIYYKGSELSFQGIQIEANNGTFINAEVIYNYKN